MRHSGRGATERSCSPGRSLTQADRRDAAPARRPLTAVSVNGLHFAKYMIENHPARRSGDGRDSSAHQSARRPWDWETASPPSARCEAIAISCAQPRTADASPGPRAVPSSATVTQRKGAGARAVTRDKTSQHRTRPDELLACGKAADCSAAPWFGYLARRCRIGRGGKDKRPA